MKAKEARAKIQAVLDNLRNARPYSCAFISGVEMERRNEVEAQLKAAFELWAKTWVAAPLMEVREMLWDKKPVRD